MNIHETMAIKGQNMSKVTSPFTCPGIERKQVLSASLFNSTWNHFAFIHQR